jgi:uncharacterized membrane protein
MGNWPWVLGGIVAGGIIHILAVFGIPSFAEGDAWSRLAATMPHNAIVVPDGKSAPTLPFSPPDVVTAYCLYDLADRNVIVRAPLSEPAWTLAVSTRSGENFYLVAGADSKRPEVRLLLIRRDRLSDEASTEKTSEGDDQNIVVAPAETGIVAIRAPIRGESFRAQTIRELQQARCELQPVEPLVASVAAPPEEPPAQQPQARPKRRGNR